MKKKYTAVLASAAALALMLTGCTGGKGSGSGSASSFAASSGAASGASSSAAQSQTEPFRAEPIDFTWQPVVYSDYQRRGRSPETEQFYRDFVNAVMKGEEVVPCQDEKTCEHMLPILQSIFPVINGINCGFEYRDGAVHISYSGSDGEREQTIEAFGRRIKELIEQAVCKGDTPTMAAIALYHSLAGGVNYDYEALEQEGQDGAMDVTPYRALMTGEGICQSFGPAYAYLCMQLGINAIEAGGWDFNEENGHSWTMLELNGHHYFADPTFENGSGGGGLRYFGQNSEARAQDNYLLKDVGLGFNLMRAEEFDLSDDSFAPLWDVQNIYEICRTAEGMEIKCHSPFPAQRSIPIEEGKRILVTPCDDNGVPLEDGGELCAPIPEDLRKTAWSGAAFDVAFLDSSLVWVESADYTGPGQCWLSAQGQLTMETDGDELEIFREGEDRLTLKGKNGEFPLTKASGEVYERLSKQSDEYWKN